jgi:hypothetical protein
MVSPDHLYLTYANEMLIVTNTENILPTPLITRYFQEIVIPESPSLVDNLLDHYIPELHVSSVSFFRLVYS